MSTRFHTRTLFLAAALAPALAVILTDAARGQDPVAAPTTTPTRDAPAAFHGRVVHPAGSPIVGVAIDFVYLTELVSRETS